MSATGVVAQTLLKGTTVFSALVLTGLGALSIAGIVASFVAVSRDGYRAVPTRRV